MRPFTYHTHSTYCDGKNTLAEIAEAALSEGLDSLGFSCHSYVPFDPIGCISPDATEGYASEIRALGDAYRHRGLDIFLGIEQDACSQKPAANAGFDYIIGSMHYIRLGDEYVTIDSKRCFHENLDRYFGGDALALSLEYFKSMESLYELTGCDIVGHFDINTKFNENGCLFDERDKRYEDAAEAAIEKLARHRLIFEINTGAMPRKYRSLPYPSSRLLSMIREAGGRVTYSSDSHSTAFLTYGFDLACRLAKDAGFDHLMKLKRTEKGCRFYPEEIEVQK